MNGYVVLKSANYTLAVTPGMIIHNGTTQTAEMVVNPELEYLEELPSHLGSFEDAVNYMPNQVYTGNEKPQKMAEVGFPWYDKLINGASKNGKYSEVTPEDRFYGLIQICGVLDLVKLEKRFAVDVRTKLNAHYVFTDEHVAILDRDSKTAQEEVAAPANNGHTEPSCLNSVLVGIVKRAHDVDVNLSAYIMSEGLVTKVSNVLFLLNLAKKARVDLVDIDYIVNCCEKACGDMNQKGGGNFAKAAAEVAGLVSTTNSDVRGSCVGSAHVMLHAAALVKAGTFKNVVVTAGGCTAKLDMDSKNHAKKGLPILEDTIAGLSVLVSTDDGVSPQIRTDIVGCHIIETGSVSQNVISSPVINSLNRVDLKIVDIDKYSPKMQNLNITKPAGAGNVPKANYKMIAAPGVKRGELQRDEVANFVGGHDMTGWAPAQRHIPSGVPHPGLLRDGVLAGGTKCIMIVNKGSLFPGGMINLFDGVSFVVQTDDGSASRENGGVDESKVKAMIGQAMKTFTEGLTGEEE